MPAPFVVAHLQVGLTPQLLDVSLTDGHIPYLYRGRARGKVPRRPPGLFLTNALMGWEVQGFGGLRIWNTEVLHNLEIMREVIARVCAEEPPFP